MLDDDDVWLIFCFQAEDGIRDLVRSRGLGDVYKRQPGGGQAAERMEQVQAAWLAWPV